MKTMTEKALTAMDWTETRRVLIAAGVSAAALYEKLRRGEALVLPPRPERGETEELQFALATKGVDDGH